MPSILDIIIAVMLILGLVRGLFTGIIRQVLSIVGLVTAFILAMVFMDTLGQRMVDELSVSPRVGAFLAFLLIFGVIEILVFLLTRFLEGALKVLRLTALNRLAGGLAGVLKSAFFLSIVFLILGLINVPDESAQAGSRLYDPVASVVPSAWDLAADHMPQVDSLAAELTDAVRAASVE